MKAPGFDDFIVFTNFENGFTRLPMSDIAYIELSYRRSFVNLKSRISVEVKEDGEAIESQLNEDFFRVHSYLIINMSNVREMKNGELLFDGGRMLHIGKGSYVKVKKRVLAYYAEEREKRIKKDREA